MEISLMSRTYPVGPTAYAPEGYVKFSHYVHDHSLAVQAYDDVIGPLWTGSVCLPDNPPQAGCFWVKDYSENEGVAEALIAAGISEPTGRIAKAGHALVEEHKLLVDPGYN
jgi:hypothetical protein